MWTKCSWSYLIGSLKTNGGLSHAKEGEGKQLPGRQKADRKLGKPGMACEGVSSTSVKPERDL